MSDFQDKYLKYKNKYFKFKNNLKGGGPDLDAILANLRKLQQSTEKANEGASTHSTGESTHGKGASTHSADPSEEMISVRECNAMIEKMLFKENLNKDKLPSDLPDNLIIEKAQGDGNCLMNAIIILLRSNGINKIDELDLSLSPTYDHQKIVTSFKLKLLKFLEKHTDAIFPDMKTAGETGIKKIDDEKKALRIDGEWLSEISIIVLCTMFNYSINLYSPSKGKYITHLIPPEIIKDYSNKYLRRILEGGLLHTGLHFDALVKKGK